MTLEARERRVEWAGVLGARLVSAIGARDRMRADKVLAEMRAFVGQTCPHITVFELTAPNTNKQKDPKT